jgi:uncharacterized membrane protein YphA (DoxX/SURF4 family)
MSVDTRTPRTPTGGGSPGFDERVLTMPRVPSDPAQVIVNHASFRVQLGATSARALGSGGVGSGGLADTARLPVVARGVAPASSAGVPAAGRRKQAPLVWSGRTAPGDPLTGELLQAVREAGAGTAATQLLPRIDETAVLPRSAAPTVVGPRTGGDPTGLLAGLRPARGAYDPADDPLDDEPQAGHLGAEAGPGGPDGFADGHRARHAPDARDGERPAVRIRRPDQVRHAWYPHRRMNLGIVLLPLRIFLGLVCIYAGMGKLCDRVYFDGGRRGSMVTWLNSLHPWGLAEPLRDAALDHPVGAGLSIAFLQVVVGVLTVFGLWQRVAAVFGAGLSIALLVTVSWRTVPVYDAPDFIYLAAWSPLVIAGAPVYSIDGHLAGDAWRRLGPRVTVWDLRRRVLRRGSVLATVIIGLTLLIGSVLGAAVRATTPQDRSPSPTVVPTNNLPGSPLPDPSADPTAGSSSPQPSHSMTGGAQSSPPTPTATPAATPGETTGSGSASPSDPSGTGTASAGSGTTHSHTGSGSAPGSAGSGSGSTTGSSAGGSGSGGTSQAPPSPAAPPAEEVPAPQPSAKPTQGAIGGLLGSHSPTGLLLGMSPQPRAYGGGGGGA